MDESKILHLLGRVTNESGETVKDIRLSAKFYDSAGNELGEFTRDAEARTLPPGASSPFEILFLDQETSELVSDYTLSATANATSELKEEKFTIKSSNSRQDLLGTFYLNAVATNAGEQTATNTIMIATLYDRDGKVVGDFRQQAVQTFENIKAALAAVGAEFRHVVKLNSYLVGVEHLPAFREVRDSYLARANRPASTTIGIAALARAGALLEIEAVAVLPAAARSKSARGSSAKRAGAARKRRTATKASRSRRK